MLVMEKVNYDELDLNAGRKMKKKKGEVLRILDNFIQSDNDCVKVKDTECHYDNGDSMARCIMNTIKFHGFNNSVRCFVLNHEVYLKRKWCGENGKDEQGSNNPIVQSDK